jgi:hypothetical protein
MMGLTGRGGRRFRFELQRSALGPTLVEVVEGCGHPATLRWPAAGHGPRWALVRWICSAAKGGSAGVTHYNSSLPPKILSHAIGRKSEKRMEIVASVTRSPFGAQTARGRSGHRPACGGVRGKMISGGPGHGVEQRGVVYARQPGDARRQRSGHSTIACRIWASDTGSLRRRITVFVRGDRRQRRPPLPVPGYSVGVCWILYSGSLPRSWRGVTPKRRR